MLALSRVRLGLEHDYISNLILTRGLLRLERRFGLGVHWGNFLWSDSVFVGGWRARASGLCMQGKQGRLTGPLGKKGK
jgi:hypothetical protein